MRSVICYTGGGVGLTLYVTYNIRIVYAYLIIGIVVIYTFVRFGKYAIRCILVMLAGALLSSVPQILVNNNLYGRITPIVFTNGYEGSEQSLTMFQLYTGIKVDRYETYIGDKKGYKSPSVYFDDKPGKEILAENGIALESFSIGDLAFLFFNYPIEMISIYSKHFINIVLPLYNQVYSTEINLNKTLSVILAIIVSIIIILHLLSVKQRYCINTIFVIALISPTFLQLFGAVEFRFGITLHIALCYSLFNIVSYKGIMRFIKKNLVLSLLLVMLILMLFSVVSTDTMLSLRDTVMLISS